MIGFNFRFHRQVTRIRERLRDGAIGTPLGVRSVFSILPHELPEWKRARRLGLLAAMGMRILLLLGISWIVSLTQPLLGVLGREFSGRDLILIGGGLFLLAKATYEIHDKLEGREHDADAPRGTISFSSVIVQILILDIVFSLDSVITAVGMVQTAPEHRAVGLTIMCISIVVAIGVMLAFSKAIADFVDRHPTVKMLAFSFLILVGVVLVVDASHRHIPKGYIYFAMAFSLAVELLNMRARKAAEKPVELHHRFEKTPGAERYLAPTHPDAAPRM